MTFETWYVQHFGPGRYPDPGILFYEDGTWPHLRMGWKSWSYRNYDRPADLVNLAALTLPA